MQAPKFALVTVLAMALIGCANTSTVKSAAGRFDNRNVEIVPTGIVKIEGTSGTALAAFGLLGALIEHAATESSRAEISARSNKIFSADNAFEIATRQIQGNISKFGNVKQVNISRRTLDSQEFTSWFNSDSRSDFRDIAKDGSQVIIDVGFQSLNVSGAYADCQLGVRIIDGRDGKVIGRARTFGAGWYSGERIIVERDNPEYADALKTAFVTLIKRLTNEAIEKITSN